MKMTFLGSGSFFSENNYHTNILLEHEGKSFLIDCGTDIRHSLPAESKTPDIDSVYISHMHSDHCGGLEYLGFYAYFIAKKKMNLYSHQTLNYPIWSALSGGMAYLDDLDAHLSTYFKVHSIDYYMNKNKFTWNGIDFTIIPSRHNYPSNDELRCRRPIQSIMSYGLQFMVGDKLVWVTTDSCEANFAEKEDWWNHPERAKHYYESDIIFHDCETFECSNVHSHYSALKKFPADIKKKISLVHYQDLGDKMPDAVADGFAGFVWKGQQYWRNVDCEWS